MACSKPYVFYEQQIEMSNRILSAFTSGEGELYGILLAQMQSGKSGTYFHLALEAIHRGFFEKVYIICGSRDTALREQTKDGLKASIESYTKDLFRTWCNDGMDPIEALELREQKIQVLVASVQVNWNQELKDVTICDKCLIINDESHTAQSKCNIPFKEFWKKNKLAACLHGDFSALRIRDIRVLSVSATSFSECVENQKVSIGMDIQEGTHLSTKNVFIMDPGPTYMGVSKFLSSGNIHFESEPISEKTNGDHLCSVLLNEKYAKKYCLVRTARATLDADLVKSIADRSGVIYKEVYGDKIKDSLGFLSNAPRHTTLVHICGIARMGQELDKTHIGFVYEQSKDPAIDTLLQGLLGRACGHNTNPDVDIFISSKREREVRDYGAAVNLSETECLTEFAKIRPALNVKASAGRKHTSGDTIIDKNRKFWRKMIPLKFPYSLLRKDVSKITHQQILAVFKEHPELIEGNPDKQFIMEELEKPDYSECMGNRWLGKPAYKDRGTAINLDAAISKGERSTDWFTNVVCDHETPDVVPFTVLQSEDRTEVYFIGFSPNEKMTQTLWKNQLGMNNTLKKCNYNPAYVVVTESGKKIHNVNGGQLIVFPKETAENDVLFHEELSKAVQRSKENPLVQCEVTSIYCNGAKEFKGIRLCNRVFDQGKIDDITKKIETEYSIKIKYTKTRGPQPTGYYQFSSISW
tara:strand:- start:13 stop:2103 length:2091 start_codon:yes stop_codon:yes gene_type:complete